MQNFFVFLQSDCTALSVMMYFRWPQHAECAEEGGAQGKFSESYFLMIFFYSDYDGNYKKNFKVAIRMD